MKNYSVFKRIVLLQCKIDKRINVIIYKYDHTNVLVCAWSREKKIYHLFIYLFIIIFSRFVSR